MSNNKVQTLHVSNVVVYPVGEPKGKLLGFARVLLNNQLQLTGIRIYAGNIGRFVSYPNDPNFKGEDYRQIFYPITRELRDVIETEVLNEFDRIMA